MTTSRSRLPFRAAALALALPVALGGLACQSDRELPYDWWLPASEVVILHTNDLHGQLLPRPATWVDRNDPPPVGGLISLARAMPFTAGVSEDGWASFRVDAGDWFTGTPEGAIDGGAAFTRALVLAGDYDAMALGNHEFDLGLANLKHVLEVSGAPVVCANLRDPKTGERVDWVEPWRIVESAEVRVAFVGLLTPTTPSITHSDAATLTFADPALELARVLEELRGRCDFIVPLSHLGHEADIELARAFAGHAARVPLIVGGHSHTFLPQGERVGEILIVQAGSRGGALGSVSLLRGEGGFRAEQAGMRSLLERDLQPVDVLEVENACTAILAKSAVEMAVVVGELTAPLERSGGLRSSGAGNLVTDALRDATGADVAIINRWGLRTNLPAGPVDRRGLFELLPFGNRVVVAELSGAELRAVMAKSLAELHEQGLEWSGLVAEIIPRASAGADLVALEVGGEPLDLARTYRVAGGDFLLGGGDHFVELGRELPLVFPGAIQRDVVEAFLAARSPYTPDTGSRYRDLGDPR